MAHIRGNSRVNAPNHSLGSMEEKKRNSNERVPIKVIVWFVCWSWKMLWQQQNSDGSMDLCAFQNRDWVKKKGQTVRIRIRGQNVEKKNLRKTYGIGIAFMFQDKFIICGKLNSIEPNWIECYKCTGITIYWIERNE